MADLPSIKITGAEISIGDIDTIGIANDALRKNFEQDPEKTLDTMKLKEIGVTVNDISIDENGKVIIKNAKLKEAAEKLDPMPMGLLDINCLNNVFCFG